MIDPKTKQELEDQEIDDQIVEQLRQLNLPDGDKDVEHPDTQFSDYPEEDEASE